MRYGILPRLMLLLLICPASLCASDAGDAVAGSLHAALAKNTSHARDWLDQKDYKSLAQSAGGLQLLAELLKARSDDAAWQAALGNAVAATSAVQAAARDEDAGKCK